MLENGAVSLDYTGISNLPDSHFDKMTATHHPVPHKTVIDTVKSSLQKFTEYSIVKEQFGTSHNHKNLFGVLHLKKDNNKNHDYDVVYGLRHSNMMHFSLKCGLGSQVIVCSNLAWMVDAECQGSKHTENVHDAFNERLNDLNRSLLSRDKDLHQKFKRYKDISLNYKDADHIIMESIRRGAITKSKCNAVDSEWRKPSYEYESTGSTMFDLFQAFTHVAKGTYFPDNVKRTKLLHKVFDAYAERTPHLFW
jgi:hypothetical protein